ncbi:hypothetical protein ABBQ38_013226 [Trebouxia sp. C0009 RCD-2024]
MVSCSWKTACVACYGHIIQNIPLLDRSDSQAELGSNSIRLSDRLGTLSAVVSFAACWFEELEKLHLDLAVLAVYCVALVKLTNLDIYFRIIYGICRSYSTCSLHVLLIRTN